MGKYKIIKDDKNDSRMITLKLIFLFGLILLAAIIPLLFKNPPVKKEKKKEFNLPKLPEIQDIEDNVRGVATRFQTQILGNTTRIVEKTASEAASTVSSVASGAASTLSETVSKTVFDAALKPIVKQIDNLPEDQQKRARELICK